MQKIIALLLFLVLLSCNKKEFLPTIQVNKNHNFEPKDPLVLLERLNEEEYIMASSKGELYLSLNKGNDWEKLPTTPFDNFRPTEIQFFSSDTGYILADEKIYKTVDKGYSWTQMRSRVTSMFFISSKIGFVLDGHVYKTINGGGSWNVTHNWPNLLTASASKIYALGDQYIFTSYDLSGPTNSSSDGGKTWSENNTRGLDPNTGIYIFSDKICITTRYGKILNSTDSLKTLNYTNMGENSDFPLTNLDIKNNYGLAVGGNVILITKDNGYSWEFRLTQNGINFPEGFSCVKILDQKNALGITYGGEVYFIELN
jgi:photosystem II stability/assembly factor-like uncharacterized protein